MLVFENFTFFIKFLPREQFYYYDYIEIVLPKLLPNCIYHDFFLSSISYRLILQKNLVKTQVHENKNTPSEIVCPIDCASLQPPSHCNLWFMLETKNCATRFFFFSNVNKELAILMTGSKTKHCDLANFVMTSGTF